MRVLHVIGNLGNGGAEAVLFRVATWPSDVEHVVASVGGPDWYSAPLCARGVAVHHLGADGLADKARLLGRLRALMREAAPDVVQGWMYRSNIVAGIAARTLGIPVVWGIHAASDSLPLGARMWLYASGALAARVPDAIVLCSTHAEEAHRRYRFGRAPNIVITNGYDTSVFEPDAGDRAATRAALGVADSTFLVGLVARWHPHKDHPNLLAALAHLRDTGHVGWHCLLVGPDMDAGNPELRAAILALDLADRVTCSGPSRDVPAIMRALDLHVLPSASESFPNVIAEAMASGTPCVATDLGDCAFMIGDTGWVVPPRTPIALADAVAAAIEERDHRPARWAERCDSGRRRVAREFGMATMIARYEAVWRRAAGRD